MRRIAVFVLAILLLTGGVSFGASTGPFFEFSFDNNLDAPANFSVTYVPHTPTAEVWRYDCHRAWARTHEAEYIVQTTPPLPGCQVPCEQCYQLVVTEPFAYTYTFTIRLPIVGTTFACKDTGILGYVDQTFYDGIKHHEDLHMLYWLELAKSTHQKLEEWSASYVSGHFPSAAQATSAGVADLLAALTQAQSVFTEHSTVDATEFGHPDCFWGLALIAGAQTWEPFDWRWNDETEKYEYIDYETYEWVPIESEVVPTWRGYDAPEFNADDLTAYASSIEVQFLTSPGNCPCIPEPSVVAMFCTSLAMFVKRRRRAA